VEIEEEMFIELMVNAPKKNDSSAIVISIIVAICCSLNLQCPPKFEVPQVC
jgi:hypothetical protein